MRDAAKEAQIARLQERVRVLEREVYAHLPNEPATLLGPVTMPSQAPEVAPTEKLYRRKLRRAPSPITRGRA